MLAYIWGTVLCTIDHAAENNPVSEATGNAFFGTLILKQSFEI